MITARYARLFANGTEIGICRNVIVDELGSANTVSPSTVTVSASVGVDAKWIKYDFSTMFDEWVRQLSFNEHLDIGIDHFFRNLKKLF